MDIRGELAEASCCRKEQRKDLELIDSSQNSTQLREQIPPFIVWRVISEGISFVESEDDEWSSRAFVRIQKAVWVYEVTEHFACIFCAFVFPNIPAMVIFFIVLGMAAFFHKLEKTVILTKTGKDRKFTCLALAVTSS